MNIADAFVKGGFIHTQREWFTGNNSNCEEKAIHFALS
jgi:hypothetical protein